MEVDALGSSWKLLRQATGGVSEIAIRRGPVERRPLQTDLADAAICRPHRAPAPSAHAASERVPSLSVSQCPAVTRARVCGPGLRTAAAPAAGGILARNPRAVGKLAPPAPGRSRVVRASARSHGGRFRPGAAREQHWREDSRDGEQAGAHGSAPHAAQRARSPPLHSAAYLLLDYWCCFLGRRRKSISTRRRLPSCLHPFSRQVPMHARPRTRDRVRASCPASPAPGVQAREEPVLHLPRI